MKKLIKLFQGPASCQLANGLAANLFLEIFIKELIP